MSHGKDDKFYAYDGKPIKVSAVCNMFSNSKCEVFRNKPKLFFVQACRGKRGGGFLDVADGATGNEEGSSAQVPPTESKDLDMVDMLIGYSSFDGYKSYRVEEGSYFIQSLVSVFRKYADKEDIMRMMTRVNDEVYRRANESSYGRTQVPTPIPTLRKLLYFWPGINFGEGP
ncbi:caspase-3 [Exaiptasia diaphana]|uniref:Caspase-3 n=1 Tax=Exaiptasia diaphana TaxID=2652724 RepID=A0A913X339_EXADI|nr:caspase-3 [Exaiptasia diaphana]